MGLNRVRRRRSARRMRAYARMMAKHSCRLAAIMTTITKARILTVDDVANHRIPLPEDWIKAAGVLKRKKGLHPLRYQRQIRREWDRRQRKLAV